MAAKRIDELAAVLARHATAEGPSETAVPGLSVFRRSEPTEWTPVVYEPAVFLVAQGTKEAKVAGETYRYDPAHYAMASVEMPLACRIRQASARAPFLAVAVRIDPVLVGELLATAPPEEPAAPGCGFVVTPVEPPLLDAASRLVALLDAPGDVATLAPLLHRELTYRLLSGAQGSRLRQLAAPGAPSQRIARAIAWIKAHVAEAIRMDALARRTGMSLAAFHRHFKTVTGVSPLQFQKRLRLLEARRLLLGAGLTASEAAFRVGYESPSQFSREYRRAFGAPPRQDALALRASVPGDAAGAWGRIAELAGEVRASEASHVEVAREGRGARSPRWVS